MGKDLFSQLLRGETQAFELIYANCYEQVERRVLKNGGSKVDAEDVFQDSLIVLYEKMQIGKIDKNITISGICAFLFVCSKNIWWRKLNKYKRVLITSKLPEGLDNETEYLIKKNERRKMIGLYLSSLQERCQKVISMYYLEEKTIKDIQEEFEYETKEAVSVLKSRCMKKLIKKLKNNLGYRDLLGF